MRWLISSDFDEISSGRNSGRRRVLKIVVSSVAQWKRKNCGEKKRENYHVKQSRSACCKSIIAPYSSSDRGIVGDVVVCCWLVVFADFRSSASSFACLYEAAKQNCKRRVSEVNFEPAPPHRCGIQIADALFREVAAEWCLWWV